MPSSSTQHLRLIDKMMASSQKRTLSSRHHKSFKIKEPKISLPEKLDGMRSKFRGFVNQIQIVTLLQPQPYPTNEARVGLVGTLLTGQT